MEITETVCHVLLIEDNPGDARLIHEMLSMTEQPRYDLTIHSSLREGLGALNDGGEPPFEVMILDLSLPDSFGIDTVVQARAAAPSIPIVVLTGLDEDEPGIQAVQAGAEDYLVKGQISYQLLNRALRYSIERKAIEQAEREQRALAEALQDTASLLTSTLDIEEVLDRILENIGHVMPHDMANIMLVEDQTVHVTRRSGYAHFDNETAKHPLSADTSPVLYHMFTTRQPLVLREMSDMPDGLIRDYHEGIGAQSYIGAPICLQDEVIGFISLFSRAPYFFEDGYGDRLNIFSEQAAIALQNARLFAESKELAAMQERQRLARDMHDSVTQTLFSANVMAESALRQWKGEDDKSFSLLQQLKGLTTSALSEMRMLLLELRPASLAQVPLPNLINQIIASVQSRRQVEITLDIDDLPDLIPEHKICLYRIVQEATNNIIKHSLATRVDIQIHVDPEYLYLKIRDNGKGFDTQMVSATSLGMSIMRERAESCEAQLSVESVIDGGTFIQVKYRIIREA